MKKYVALLLLILICFNTVIGVGATFSFGLLEDDSLAVPPVILNVWYSDAYKFVIDECFLVKTVTYVNDGVNYTYINDYDYIDERLVNRSDVAVVLDRYMWSNSTLYDYLYDNSTVGYYYVDVPDGQYYTPAIEYMSRHGITNGVGGKYFAPYRTVTREEFVTILFRFTKVEMSHAIDTSERAPIDMFADVSSVSMWAEDAMSWAVAEGLISGKPGNLLAPQDNITKYELATIIYRYNNNVRSHQDIAKDFCTWD